MRIGKERRGRKIGERKEGMRRLLEDRTERGSKED